jgi:hypothetical protein
MLKRISGDGLEMTIDSDLEAQLNEALGDAERQIIDLMRSEARRLGDQARRLMPVKTGQARDSIRDSVEIEGDGTVTMRVTGHEKIRYINSSQIALLIGGDREAYFKKLAGEDVTEFIPALGTSVTFKGREQAVDDPRGRNLGALKLMIEMDQIGSRAHMNGAPMWMLIRWPEKDSAKNVIRPAVEDYMVKQLRKNLEK